MLANSLANLIRTLPFIGPDLPVRVAIMEATAPKGVIVMAPLAGLTTMGEIENYFAGNMQVIVRDPDPLAGDALARQIQDALKVIGTPRDVENYKITFMKPRGEPIMYPINDAGLFEHSVNFETRAYRQL